jgi:hypothetical protein
LPQLLRPRRERPGRRRVPEKRDEMASSEVEQAVMAPLVPANVAIEQ